MGSDSGREQDREDVAAALMSTGGGARAGQPGTDCTAPVPPGKWTAGVLSDSRGLVEDLMSATVAGSSVSKGVGRTGAREIWSPAVLL